MANRTTCWWCRRGVRAEEIRYPLHRLLCPEHKRLRNRLQRAAAVPEEDG